MAILEEEVLIGLGGNNSEYYEKLGYEIPKYIDKQGRMRIKRGTKILVRIEHVNENSGVKVTKICDDKQCEIKGGRHVKDQEYKSIINCRKNGDGRDRCNKCAKKLMGKKMLNNVNYEKSLEYWAKNNGKEYLLDEFSNINEKRPFEISYGTNDQYWWKCLNGHEPYLQRVDLRTNKRSSGCSVCSGNKKKTTEEFKNEVYNLVGEEYEILDIYINNDTDVEIKHVSCGNVYKGTPRNFLSGSRCPYCHQSKGEKRIQNWLEKVKVQYIIQKEFDNLIGYGGGNLSYDFYLSSYNLLIEYQGIQHEKYIKNMHGNVENFKKQQEHDKRKRVYTIKNNIKLLEIWYWDYDNIEKILKEELNVH